MNGLKITMLFALALAFVACDSSEVQMVKGGTLQSCPDKTVEQMVNGYMGNPEWRSLVGEDGNDYVNVVGEISYNNQPTKAEIQFRLNKEKSSFQFQAWELGGVPALDIVAAALLEKMCYVELEELAKELVEAKVEMEKSEKKAPSPSVEKEMKELVEKCKQQNEISDKDLIDVMTCVEKNTKNQELIQNFVLPAKKSAELMLKIKSLPKDRQDIVEKYAMEDPRMAKEKAKKSASVIVPSMGMFKKLLDAYSIENERLGTWIAIGYDAVESSEFSFNQITKLDEFFGAFVVIEGVKATNLVELAECPALSSWIMRCGLNSEKEVVCECSIESENKDACAEIAPSFMRLCE